MGKKSKIKEREKRIFDLFSYINYTEILGNQSVTLKQNMEVTILNIFFCLNCVMD